MSGKKNMKSKQQTMVENSTESKVTESAAPLVAAPLAVAPLAVAPQAVAPLAVAPLAVVAPVESKQKGGRGKKAAVPAAVQATVPEVAAPVSAAPVAATESVAPVKKQRGGRKKVEAAVESVATEATVTKPKSRVSKTKVQSDDSKADDAKVVKPKVSRKKKSEPVVADTPVVEAEENSDKHIRSFKVKLPGSETFEGRFTGLTPYQAANKALSKYFREGERTDNDVTFSICESTRKSKKSVYTYVGKRHKLEVPVKYSIQDGREIVKNFKNTLKKVKKSENVALAPPTDTSVSMGASA